jgi:hypothetical protein
VFTKPVVIVKVPETVPVFVPLNNEFALEKVTPVADELLIVILVKLAVGDAVKFLKTPVPLTDWAIVCAVTVGVDIFACVTCPKVSVPVLVKVPLFTMFPPMI